MNRGTMGDPRKHIEELHEKIADANAGFNAAYTLQEHWHKEAQRLERRVDYTIQFLAEFEHLRCVDDCEGFRDPCLACVVHEALRRLR